MAAPMRLAAVPMPTAVARTWVGNSSLGITISRKFEDPERKANRQTAVKITIIGSPGTSPAIPQITAMPAKE